MRPGSALATACLAVLSVWRFADGEPVWAAVFAGLALAHLAFALRRRDAAPGGAAADPSRRGWVRIAIASLVLAVAAVFWFPPLALVLAALGLYSAHRPRGPRGPSGVLPVTSRSGRERGLVRHAPRAVGEDGGAPPA